MDENSRKRTSKWDLIDGHRNHEDNGRDNARSGNYRASSNEYRSYSGHHSSAHNADNDTKYPTDVNVRSKYEPAESVRDHASLNRGSWRENSPDRSNRGFSEAGTNWDDNGSRRDHGRSPRSSWKSQLRSTSRGRSRSRSRSRSPVRAYRHDSGVNDRPRSKPEVPNQTCRDFTSGRCRRGSHCPFLHPSAENYEDRRYDIKHREESVRGGKYSHHEYNNDYSAEALQPKRDYDRNSRGASFNNGADRGPRRTADIPCTFFAAGNCRNGNLCHFSHQTPSRSSGGRAHDGRWKTNHSPDKAVQMDRVSKFSDTVDLRAAEYGKEERWRKNRSSDRVDQSDRGLELSETAYPCDLEYVNESHGKGVSPQSRSKAVSTSMNSGWGKNAEASYVMHGGPTNTDIAVEAETNQSSQWKTDNTGSFTNTSEMKAADNWIGDKMSPEWNPKSSSAGTAAKEVPAYSNQKSESVHHNAPSQSSPMTHYGSFAMPDAAEKLNFQQSFCSINDAAGALPYDINVGGNVAGNFSTSFLPDHSGQPSTQNVPNGTHNLNAVSQGQLLPTPNHPGNEITSAFRNSVSNYDDPKMSEAISGVMPASTMVRQEQLAQLTDLSASLAHLLGKGQQLPQFYAAINPPNPVPSAEAAQAYLPIGSKKPYEPVWDKAAQMQPDTSITPTQYPPNPSNIRTTVDVKQETPSGEQNMDAIYTNGSTEGTLSHKPDIDSKPIKKPETKPEESTKEKDKHVKSPEGSPLENRESKVEGGKKVKDTKALRDFKFALVNFVKELLKPAWKDGKINKDGFKTIVKKATDKVTATMQDASIPQTPEKVEQYLSASKPKLDKLLQAYVDRNQKKKT